MKANWWLSLCLMLVSTGAAAAGRPVTLEEARSAALAQSLEGAELDLALAQDAQVLRDMIKRTFRGRQPRLRPARALAAAHVSWGRRRQRARVRRPLDGSRRGALADVRVELERSDVWHGRLAVVAELPHAARHGERRSVAVARAQQQRVDGDLAQQHGDAAHLPSHERVWRRRLCPRGGRRGGRGGGGGGAAAAALIVAV